MAECVHLSIYLSISLATLFHMIPFHPKLHKDRSWLIVEQLETRQGNNTNATEAHYWPGTQTGIDDLGSWSLARTVHITLPFTQKSNGSHFGWNDKWFLDLWWWFVVIVYFSGQRWKEVAVVCVGWTQWREKKRIVRVQQHKWPAYMYGYCHRGDLEKQSVTTSCVIFSARLCLLLSALQCRPGGSRVDF